MLTEVFELIKFLATLGFIGGISVAFILRKPRERKPKPRPQQQFQPIQRPWVPIHQQKLQQGLHDIAVRPEMSDAEIVHAVRSQTGIPAPRQQPQFK